MVVVCPWMFLDQSAFKQVNTYSVWFSLVSSISFLEVYTGIQQVRGRVAAEFRDLSNKLHVARLHQYKRDKWRWKGGIDGCFSVKLMRAFLDEKLQDQRIVNEHTFWSRLLPKKVCILAWRVDRKRIPVRSKLLDKGVDIPNALCPRCGDEVETVDHAMFNCHQVIPTWRFLHRPTWRFLHRWWAVPFSGGSSFKDFESAAQGILQAWCFKVWQLLIRSAAYFLWKNRNLIVFSDPKYKGHDVSYEIQLMLFQWLRGRSKKGKQISWDTWVTIPSEIMGLK